MLPHRFVTIVFSLSFGVTLAVTTSPAAAQCELQETQKLIASDGGESDTFGSAVSISGNTLVVGVPNHNCAACGSAYVFRLIGANWVQEAELIPTDLAPFDGFGRAVAVDGDRIVIGASGSDPNGVSMAGAAYVFRFNGTAWVQEAKLTAPDAAELDHFGISVAIRADRVLVGASDKDHSGLIDAGAVYVFRRQGTAWVQEARLTPSNACDYQNFGVSVSFDGNRALVVAPEEFCPDTVASPIGASHVFRRNGTMWVQEAKLLPPGLVVVFGVFVSIADDLAIVSEETRVFIFRRAGTAWSLEKELTPPGGGTVVSFSVAVSGDRAVVGARFDGAGAGYVYRFDGADWVQLARLTASDAMPGDSLGNAVSMSGDRVLLGAPGEDNAGGINAGSAYVFDLPHDCNANGVADDCDIASGTSQDLDGNGYPDECCVAVASPVAELGAIVKNRYITLIPGNPGVSTALRVTLSSLHHPDPPTLPSRPPSDFSTFEGQVRWIGPPGDFTESRSNGTTFKAAQLQCFPHYMDWSAVGVLHVYGNAIVPSSLYDVQAVTLECSSTVEANYSLPALPVATARWGDLAPPYQQSCADSACSPCTALDCVSQPDALDIASLVNKIKELAGAPSKVEAQLQPTAPNPSDDLNALDIVAAVDAFKDIGYAFPGPTACPP